MGYRSPVDDVHPRPAMRLTYVLLSPTFGMHQYTADLANRAAQGSGIRDQGASGAEARVTWPPATAFTW